jgi:hypothetical protein
MEEILKKIADPKMRSQIEKVVPFHGYLSTGAFAGIQMLNIARRVLEASDGDGLFVTCETYKSREIIIHISFFLLAVSDPPPGPPATPCGGLQPPQRRGVDQ